MAVHRDHYQLLGIPRDAAPDEIKKAFRKLARECHPDVAGDTPEAAARFTAIREAYEVLSDPQQRSRYDRRFRRRTRHTPQGYRMPGGLHFDTGVRRPDRPGAARSRMRSAANNLDLDDIIGGVGDFGFGGPSSAPPPPAAGSTHSEQVRTAGRDISVKVHVPAEVARDGGTVTLHYPRLILDQSRTRLGRTNEIHDLKVPPGTRHGETLRVARMGDAGTDGGMGDLVCECQVVADAPEAPHVRRTRARTRSARVDPPKPTPARPTPAPAQEAGDDLIVDISVGEALLGGRVEIAVPGGRVRVSVPPCTSSGKRLRLKGRGADGADLMVRLRIMVPRVLDDESRELIERFVELNPEDPRG